MITKQAYLNLAAVDNRFAAELEKRGAWGDTIRTGLGKVKGWFNGAAPAAPAAPATPPPKSPFNPELRRKLRARRAAQKDALSYVDQKVQNAPAAAGQFLGDAVTFGQARSGYGQMQRALKAPGGVKQNEYNQGLLNLAKGVGKSALLYGGLGYGGYRMLRDDAPQAPIASMYSQAMPY